MRVAIGGGLATAELKHGQPLLAQGLTTVFVNPDGGGPVDLAAQPFAPVIPMTAPTMPEMPDAGINLVSTLSQMERDLILTYLKKAGGNKRQAARMLQLSRTTLIDKLHRLGVTEREPATTSNIAVA